MDVLDLDIDRALVTAVAPRLILPSIGKNISVWREQSYKIYILGLWHFHGFERIGKFALLKFYKPMCKSYNTAMSTHANFAFSIFHIMKPALANNPYVALDQDKVRIDCGTSHYYLSLRNIMRIHISKRKSGYFQELMGQLLRTRTMHYNLNIETRDQGWIQIPINPLERFFCIQLVNVLRLRLKKSAESGGNLA